MMFVKELRHCIIISGEGFRRGSVLEDVGLTSDGPLEGPLGVAYCLVYMMEMWLERSTRIGGISSMSFSRCVVLV